MRMTMKRNTIDRQLEYRVDTIEGTNYTREFKHY
jgi:hypothetical protein